MPDPQSHAQNRNWLERVLLHLPGFNGYLEKEFRRDSDALQRQHLANLLQQGKAGLDSYARKRVDSGKIEGLAECDRLRGKLDRLQGRIRGAMQGYSGVFDLVKVNEALLDRVYEFDVKLLERVETLSSKLKDLAASSDDPATEVPPLLGEVDALDHDWEQRGNLLKGLA